MASEDSDSYDTESWTLYAHTQSTLDTYNSSYTPLATVADLRAFARLWNHVHPQLVGSLTHGVAIAKQRVYSWSFFRSDVSPEWEHPRNHGGHTLTYRVPPSARGGVAELWKTLVIECVRGAEPEGVLGVQVTQKLARGASFVKFDVWLASTYAPPEGIAWLIDVTGQTFAVSPRAI